MKTPLSLQEIQTLFKEQKYDLLFDMYENNMLSEKQKIQYHIEVNNCTDEIAEMIVKKQYMDTGI